MILALETALYVKKTNLSVSYCGEAWERAAGNVLEHRGAVVLYPLVAALSFLLGMDTAELPT